MRRTLLIMLAILPGCRAPAQRQAPTIEEIRGATCAGILDQPIQFADGRWEGEPGMMVALEEGLYLAGDLRGDGGRQAAVLLHETTGGSGGFEHLAVMEIAGKGVLCLAAARIGDRIQIRSAALDGKRIRLGVIQQGPDDPMCCPTRKVSRSWIFTGAELTEEPAVDEGTFSIDDLAGTAWVLRSWDSAGGLESLPEITLSFEKGRVAGRSSCNQYAASIIPGPAPGELSLDPITTTRKGCEDPLMRLEQSYLTALEHVTHAGFEATRLTLISDQENVIDTMIFEPRQPGSDNGNGKRP